VESGEIVSSQYSSRRPLHAGANRYIASLAPPPLDMIFVFLTCSWIMEFLWWWNERKERR
jgi:hypothetical protein